MARRKKKSSDSAAILVGTAGAFCILYMVVALFRGDSTALPFLLFIAAAIILLFIVLPNWRRNRVLETVDTITNQHIDALIRQHTILIRSDPYGKPILDKWHSEVSYFINHHIRPSLRQNQQPIVDKHWTVISQRVSQWVEYAAQQRPVFTVVPANMPPAEFETFCAETLRAYGWGVRRTPLSHDQGVDVIAEKNGVRVVLQCKLYSNPVGNKAVQEIAAGRVHQQAHYGAVVTNSTYTESAKELATTNGIWLLHYTDLPQLEQSLSTTVAQ
jgi:restriction system protein